MQPVFITKAQKKNLLGGYDAYKKTALLQGKSESDWLAERQELIRLINDDFELIGFSQSCQVCGIK